MSICWCYNELTERGQKFRNMIERAVHNMRQLIDDLLDMAYIDAGLELKPGSVDLRQAVQDTVTDLKTLADEKQIDIQINLSTDLPPVAGDQKLLRQIVANLVSNAIKYTPPEGHVNVWAETREDMVMVFVKDDGMGISPEDQAQIFERFYRVRTPETDSIEGTGLGLAIAKSLVETHRGQIGLSSRLGEGTTFYFTIPCASTVETD